MRTVNLRQLQMHFYSEVKDLPILVTKMDRHTKKVEPFCVILPANEDPLNIAPENPQTGAVEENHPTVEEDKNSPTNLYDKLKRKFVAH